MDTGGLHSLLVLICGSLVGFSLGLLGVYIEWHSLRALMP